jgi:hypothetical protein
MSFATNTNMKEALIGPEGGFVLIHQKAATLMELTLNGWMDLMLGTPNVKRIRELGGVEVGGKLGGGWQQKELVDC